MEINIEKKKVKTELFVKVSSVSGSVLCSCRLILLGLVHFVFSYFGHAGGGFFGRWSSSEIQRKMRRWRRVLALRFEKSGEQVRVEHLVVWQSTDAPKARKRHRTDAMESGQLCKRGNTGQTGAEWRHTETTDREGRSR